MPLVDEFLNPFIAAWNAHDINRVVAQYAPDYEEIDVARSAPIRGSDAVGRRLTYYLRAFPDLQVMLDDWIADDERVAIYWTWTGTHRGTFMNIPATGHSVKVRGTSLIMLADGKIQRALRIWDLAGLLRDLHLLPELVS